MAISPLQLLRPRQLPESIYVEIINDLFSATPSIVVFMVSQCVIGTVIFLETGDRTILGLTLLAVLVSAERIWMIHRYHRTAEGRKLSRDEAAGWERQFAIRSVATAVVVSATGVRCFILPDPAVHMLIVGVISTYAAGTVTRVAYRPRLALINLFIVAIPPSIACMAHGGLIYISLGLVTLIFLIGAFDIIQHAYDTAISQLSLKRRFAGLAQRDALTGLANRLGLSENLETVIAEAQRGGHGLAVHSLDLDRFKAANDLYGHPAGDAILKEVARRLTRLTRASDLLVRLGGDEFVLVQTGVAEREQAIGLASRIVEDIGNYYTINGYTIEIGTSVGIALLTDEDLAPEDLLARADQALYQAKRTRSGYAVYTVAPHLVPSPADGDDFQDHHAVNRRTVNSR
ncbi:MAG: GGDEF domain-containing protein [Afipia sp.]|nr:GGDEF domain-containing protein [Afipia sp.]